MSDNIKMLFFGIVIGIMIGGLLTALNIGYQVIRYDDKTKTDEVLCKDEVVKEIGE